MAALGRTFHVGQLYDVRRDMILAESLWDHKTVNEKKECKLHPGQLYKFIVEDTQSNKFDSLHINGSLELSFCASLVDVGGSADFLKSSRSSEHVSRVTLMFTSTQRYEEISQSVLNQVEYGDVLKRTNATHVVSHVDYGYNAFFVFDRRVSEKEDKKKIHVDMHAAIKKIPSLSADANISGKLSGREKEELSKFYCTFYGDFSPEFVPTTFEEAVKICHDIPKLLGITGQIDPTSEIGKPQVVTLYPVSSLKGAQDVPQITSISGSAKIQVPFLMQYLADASTAADDLSDDTVCPRFENLSNEVGSFQRTVDSFKDEVKTYLKTTIPSIRSGDRKESDLAKFLNDIEKSPFGSAALNSYIHRKKKEFALLAQTLKNMDLGSKKNVVEVFPGSSCDLGTLLIDSKNKFVFCFVFNVKSSTKPLTYIEGMEKYLMEFIDDKKINPNEKFAAPGDDKEWFDSLHAISKFRKVPSYFLDLAAACNGQKDVIFAVTNNHEDVETGDPVTLLYDEGDLVCKDYSAPLAKPDVKFLVSCGYDRVFNIETSTGIVRWPPLQHAKEYLIWRDEDRNKILDHTAAKTTVSLSDVEANMNKDYG